MSMRSPVHPDIEMKKINKMGIEIEYCPKSGGVWLDHGELEKLIETVESRLKQDNYGDEMAPKIDEHNDKKEKYEDDEDDYKYKNYSKKKKRESILGEIFDIF